MPTVNISNCDYYYEIHGSGEETIVLSHGLLLSGKLFEKQVDYFKSKYTIITYDHRGHGQSEVTKYGYAINNLCDDSILLLEHLNLKQVHFVGLSMGADVAMRLTIKRPDLVKSLILMGASASPETNAIKYKLLKNVVKFSGIKTVLSPVLISMFGEKFLNDPNRKDELEKWTIELLKNKNNIYRSLNAAITRKIIDEKKLQTISCPTLILVGTKDKATSPDKSEFIHSKIENSTLKHIKESGHLLCIEEPEKCNYEIEQFLNQFNV